MRRYDGVPGPGYPKDGERRYPMWLTYGEWQRLGAWSHDLFIGRGRRRKLREPDDEDRALVQLLREQFFRTVWTADGHDSWMFDDSDGEEAGQAREAPERSEGEA